LVSESRVAHVQQAVGRGIADGMRTKICLTVQREQRSRNRYRIRARFDDGREYKRETDQIDSLALRADDAYDL
jgi:hypothetical protein